MDRGSERRAAGNRGARGLSSDRFLRYGPVRRTVAASNISARPSTTDNTAVLKKGRPKDGPSLGRKHPRRADRNRRQSVAALQQTTPLPAKGKHKRAALPPNFLTCAVLSAGAAKLLNRRPFRFELTFASAPVRGTELAGAWIAAVAAQVFLATDAAKLMREAGLTPPEATSCRSATSMSTSLGTKAVM